MLSQQQNSLVFPVVQNIQVSRKFRRWTELGTFKELIQIPSKNLTRNTN